MRTKELIAMLQNADPSGEIECCVGNVDIVDVDVMPAYYDGRLQVLTRDPMREVPWSVVGAKYMSSGKKLTIRTYCISDAVYDQPDLPVDCTEAPHYKDAVDDCRKQRAIVMTNVELDLFQRWVKEKAVEIESDMRGLLSAATTFFDQEQMRYDDLLQVTPGKSYTDCRFEQWDSKYSVSYHDLDWHILRKT